MWGVLALAALSWTAPPTCPKAAWVSSELSRLGVRADERQALDVRGTVTLADGAYTLALELRVGTVTGQRRLTSATCNEVARAGAVVIALAARRERERTQQRRRGAVVAARFPESPSEPSASPARARDQAPPATDPPPARCPTPAPPPSTLLPPRLLLSLGGALGVGDLTDLAGGATLGVGAALRPSSSVEVSARLQLAAFPAAASPGDGPGITASALAVRVAPCLGRSLGRGITPDVCLGPSYTALAVEGRDVEKPRTASAGYWSLFAGAGFRFAVLTDTLGLRVLGGFLVPLARPTFEVTELGRVHRVAPYQGRVEVALELF